MAEKRCLTQPNSPDSRAEFIGAGSGKECLLRASCSSEANGRLLPAITSVLVRQMGVASSELDS